ncbi:hypothetical protein BJH92_22195 [Paenibacillus polymyxa]|nr:hypothetical protein BJH92_22195 [Paenibacillus polymyxa]
MRSGLHIARILEEDGIHMKIIITQKEAADKGIWTEIMGMFAVTKEDEVWQNEEFILTEEQARQVGLLK